MAMKCIQILKKMSKRAGISLEAVEERKRHTLLYYSREADDKLLVFTASKGGWSDKNQRNAFADMLRFASGKDHGLKIARREGVISLSARHGSQPS